MPGCVNNLDSSETQTDSLQRRDTKETERVRQIGDFAASVKIIG